MGTQRFSPVFISFQQEGFLTHSCIANGLTEIRNANIGDIKGRFYTGFFQLSIGIERIAKLVIILDYMLENSMKLPTSKVIKDHGHDLECLYKSVIEVANSHKFEVNLNLCPIQERILQFLANFAKCTRYANIDSLTETKRQSTAEPLEEWNTILLDIFYSDVHKKTRERILKQANLLHFMLTDKVFAMGTDLDGDDTDLQKRIFKSKLIEEASRHSVWHLVTLIQPITDTLKKLVYIAHESSNDPKLIVPYMGDFYAFLNIEKKAAMSRKKW